MTNLQVRNVMKLLQQFTTKCKKNEKWSLFVDLVKMSKYLYDIVNSKILNIDDGSGGSDVGM